MDTNSVGRPLCSPQHLEKRCSTKFCEANFAMVLIKLDPAIDGRKCPSIQACYGIPYFTNLDSLVLTSARVPNFINMKLVTKNAMSSTGAKASASSAFSRSWKI